MILSLRNEDKNARRIALHAFLLVCPSTHNFYYAIIFYCSSFSFFFSLVLLRLLSSVTTSKLKKKKSIAPSRQCLPLDLCRKISSSLFFLFDGKCHYLSFDFVSCMLAAREREIGDTDDSAKFSSRRDFFHSLFILKLVRCSPALQSLILVRLTALRWKIPSEANMMPRIEKEKINFKSNLSSIFHRRREAKLNEKKNSQHCETFVSRKNIDWNSPALLHEWGKTQSVVWLITQNSKVVNHRTKQLHPFTLYRRHKKKSRTTEHKIQLSMETSSPAATVTHLLSLSCNHDCVVKELKSRVVERQWKKSTLVDSTLPYREENQLEKKKRWKKSDSERIPFTCNQFSKSEIQQRVTSENTHKSELRWWFSALPEYCFSPAAIISLSWNRTAISHQTPEKRKNKPWVSAVR